jgi:hypothetical protein
VEFLGEPIATMGALQGIGHTCRGGQQLTQVLPDQRVKWLGRTLACLTTMIMLRIHRLGRAATHVVAMAMFRRAGDTGRLTHATADERSPSGVMGLVMARRLSFLERQFGLDPVEALLGDEWRNGRHPCPGFRCRRDLTVGRLPQGVGRRPSDMGWPGVGTANIAPPCVGRVRSEPVQGGRTPAPIPSWSLDAELE